MNEYSKPGPTSLLKFDYVDDGAARIYYKGPKGVRYCFQQETSIQDVVFYICSKDGEPDCPAVLSDTVKVERPVGPSMLVVGVNSYLRRLKGPSRLLPVSYMCDQCGSENVRFDSISVWCKDTQSFETVNTMDSGHSCEDCGFGNVSPIEVEINQKGGVHRRLE